MIKILKIIHNNRELELKHPRVSIQTRCKIVNKLILLNLIIIKIWKIQMISNK